eukprot:TRINITY_DN10051_c0_g1_i1.p1 TRINITY_DN10051_c0_g1~~TRINITY_DN10051_c0_g1_i1.p1  ORF type:complete len:132 (+),score=2.35 TRINITY_DN10051_c0_g1_i1:108-503(+)
MCSGFPDQLLNIVMRFIDVHTLARILLVDKSAYESTQTFATQVVYDIAVIPRMRGWFRRWFHAQVVRIHAFESGEMLGTHVTGIVRFFIDIVNVRGLHFHGCLNHEYKYDPKFVEHVNANRKLRELGLHHP